MARPADALVDLVELLSTLAITLPTGSPVFWSGPGMRSAANAWAESTGNFTIEMTPAGEALTSADLSMFPGSAELERLLWDWLSSRLAGAASSDAFTFLNNPSAGSTWSRVEEPILNENQVTIHDLNGKVC